MKIKILTLILFIATAISAQNIQTENLKRHIQYLASDKLKGRAPGEKGEKLAAKYLRNEYKTYEKSSDSKLKKSITQGFVYHEGTNPHDTAGKVKRTGMNVITWLDNGAPYTIIIGAHYDHLGEGKFPGSLDPKPKGKIHNGADDNASGTAGVLELARYYATNGVTEPCNFLFIHFSAEESGLIGSKFYSNDPSIDLSKVQCMINMDMIGRLSDSTHHLMVHGVGTSPAFGPLLEQLKPAGIHLKPDSSGVGPSDFTSFYLKDIPVLGFFTGSHSDYHKPSDDADKINYEGERVVLEYIVSVIDSVSRMPKLPFTKTRNSSNDRVSFMVTLGILPDYSYEGKGIRVDGVAEGKAAEKAGLKAGDIIIQLGDMPVNSMQDYMKALASFKKGESTEVIITRGGKEMKFPIHFAK